MVILVILIEYAETVEMWEERLTPKYS